MFKNELEKYKIIKDLVDHGSNKNRAVVNLGLSMRQIQRLIKKYKEKGNSGFVHSNRSRKPAKTIDEIAAHTSDFSHECIAKNICYL